VLRRTMLAALTLPPLLPPHLPLPRQARASASALLSRNGLEAPAAAAFLAFLLCPEGEAAFAWHGWTRAG
jgi:hypothetical protein